MRGYHDEMGGPDSVASPSEWGPLSFGDDGMTAAGLPASPGAPSALPSDDDRRRVLFERGMRFLREQPSEVRLNPHLNLAQLRDLHAKGVLPAGGETLRHNTLLRRSIVDPGYGASRGFDWRESALAALHVPYVKPAPSPSETRARRIANGAWPDRESPSE